MPNLGRLTVCNKKSIFCLLIKENFQLPVEGGGGPALGPELVHGEQILDVVIEELLEQLLGGVTVLLGPLLSRLSVNVTSLK